MFLGLWKHLLHASTMRHMTFVCQDFSSSPNLGWAPPCAAPPLGALSCAHHTSVGRNTSWPYFLYPLVSCVAAEGSSALTGASRGCCPAVIRLRLRQTSLVSSILSMFNFFSNATFNSQEREEARQELATAKAALALAQDKVRVVSMFLQSFSAFVIFILFIQHVSAGAPPFPSQHFVYFCVAYPHLLLLSHC